MDCCSKAQTMSAQSEREKDYDEPFEAGGCGKIEVRIIAREEVEEALRQRISWSPSPSKPQRINQLGCYPFSF